jgi:hypothetical protein
MRTDASQQATHNCHRGSTPPREYTKPEVRSADHSMEKTPACEPAVTRAGWLFGVIGPFGPLEDGPV